MLAYIEGAIIGSGLNFLIVKPDKIGYRVFVAGKLIASDKKEISLYLHHHIREDSEELYGFEKLDEMNFFELLLTVSGVGPKMGLAIINQLSTEKLKEIVINNDSGLLTSVPGVGKKLAAKIIVELKNRLDKIDNLSLESLDGGSDISEALKTLGFQSSEISTALKEMPSDVKDLSQKIQWCVRFLGK